MSAETQIKAGTHESAKSHRTVAEHGKDEHDNGHLASPGGAPHRASHTGDLGMTRPSSSDVKDFQHDFDAIRADVSALTDTVGKLASEAVNFAMGKSSGKAGKRLRRAGDEMWEGSQELGDDLVGAVEHEISRHPLRSVLIALGVGVAVGLFTFR